MDLEPADAGEVPARGQRRQGGSLRRRLRLRPEWQNGGRGREVADHAQEQGVSPEAEDTGGARVEIVEV